MKHGMLRVAGLTLAVTAWSCGNPPEPQKPSAATVAPAVPTEDVESTVMQLEKDWVSAIEKKDTAALDRLLADDFVGTSPTSHTYTKTQAIRDITDARYVVDTMELHDVSVNVYGTTAVSFTSQEEKSKYERQDTSGHYHFTDVWVKKGGRWQAVASQGTRYDKAEAGEQKTQRK